MSFQKKKTIGIEENEMSKFLHGYLLSVRFKNNSRDYTYAYHYPVQLGSPVIVDSPYEGLVVTSCISCTPCYEEEEFFKKKLAVSHIPGLWREGQIKHSEKSKEIEEQSKKKKALKAKLDAAVKKIREKEDYSILKGTEFEPLLKELHNL